MLLHVFKICDALTKCSGIIPPDYHKWYLKLYSNGKEKLGSKSAADEKVFCVAPIQSNIVSCLQT